jgi:hypothetical protein
VKQIGACKRLDDVYEKAKAARDKVKILTPARAAAEKKVKEARRALQTCIKTNSGNGGILYSKGLARAAADAGVKFGLAPDFQKGKGLFKGGDIARKHFKVKKNEEIMPLAKKFAKKHALEEAAQHASAVYVLKDALLGTQVGFISAQVGLAVLDAVASVVTVGGYAAAAPFIHMGVGAAQTVSVVAIKADMTKQEEMYKNALAKRQSKIDAAAAMKAQKQQEAAAKELAAAAGTRQSTALDTAASVKPWYTEPAVIGAAVLLSAAVVGFIAKKGSS